MSPGAPGVWIRMRTLVLLGAALLASTAHAKPLDVAPWLEATCASGKERTRSTLVALPATTRPPTRSWNLAAEVERDASGYRVDGRRVGESDLLDAIGRALREGTAVPNGAIALLVDRSTPAAEVAPLLAVVRELPPRPLIVVLRSIGGVALPPEPDPEAALARDVQVRAVLRSSPHRMAQIHALTALGPRLAVPDGTCPELDVALRTVAGALPDCALAAADVVGTLRRCGLTDAGTRRAATIVGLTWAPPESPPATGLPVTLSATGEPLAGTWEDLVHKLLSAEQATIAVP